MEVAKLWATIGADSSALGNALRKADRDLNVAAKGFGQFQSVVDIGFKAIAVAGAAVFAGVAMGMTKAIKTAAGIQQQAANISAVFGDMAPPVEEVKKLMGDIALDPTLKASSAEAGGAIEELAKAGMSWEKIAGGMARQTVLLANATGSDLTLAATIASDAMSIFRLGTEDMNRIVAGAVGVTNMSKFALEDYTYILANVGPTAAALGIPLEEMNALIAMTASSFTSGRTAGTSWALLLQNLVPQSDKAAEAMKELGLMTEDGKNQFFDANGQLKDTAEVLSILRNTFGGLTQEQQVNYSRTIFGRDAYGALQAVLQLNTSELDAMTSAMTDMDAVLEGAKTRTSTFEAAFQLVGDTINSVMGMVGDKFLPVLTDLARWFADYVKIHAPAVVEWFGKVAQTMELGVGWLKEWVETGNMFGPAFDALPAPIQNAIKAIKGFIDIVGHVIRTIGDFVGQFVTWNDVWTAFGLLIGVTLVTAIAGFVLAISPLLLVIGGAIAAVAALRLAWESDWLGIRTAFGPVVDYILHGFAVLSDMFWLFVADGKITSEEFSHLWQIAASYVGNALTMIWTRVQLAFSNIVAEVAGFIQKWDVHISNLTGGLLSLGDIVAGLAIVIGVTLVRAFLAYAIPAVTAFIAAVAPFLGWVALAVAAVAAMRLAWENDWMGIRTAFEPVLGIIQRGVGLLLDLFGDIIADGKITGEEWGLLWDGIQIVFERVGAAIWKGVEGVFDNIWDKIVEFGNKAWDEFAVRFPKTAAALESAFETAKTNVGTAMDYLKDRFGPLGEAIKTFGVESLKEIGLWATGQETEFTATSAIWETARDTFSVIMGDIGNVIAEFGNKAWDEFAVRFPKTAAALESAFETAKTNVGTAMDYLKDRFGPLGEAIKTFGVESLKEIGLWATGQETEFTATSAIWETARDTFSVIMGDIGNVIAEFGNEAWDEFAVRFPKTAAEFERVAGLMRDKIVTIWGEISSGSKTLGDVLEEEFATQFPKTAATHVQGVERISKAWKDFRDALKLYVEDIKLIWADLTGQSATTSGGLTKDWDTAKERLDFIFAAMVTIVETSMALILGGLTLGMQLAMGDWSGAWGTMQTMTGTALSAMGTIIKLGLDFILGLFGLSTEDVGEMATLMIGHGRAWITNFVTEARSVWQQLQFEWGLIWTNIIEPVVDVIGDMVQYGRDLIQGFWDGVKTKWKEFTDWFGARWGELTTNFKAFFGIHSPSTLFQQFGLSLGQGLQFGIEAGTGGALSAMSYLSTGILSTASGLQSSLGGILGGINTQIEQLATASRTVMTYAPQYTPSATVSPLQQAINALNLPATFFTSGGGQGTMQLFGDLTEYADDFARAIRTFIAPQQAFDTPEQFDAAVAAGWVGAGYGTALNTALSPLTASEDALINAINALISAIRNSPNAGQGQQFNLNVAPTSTGNLYNDLAAQVQYLRTLFAS